MRSLITVFIVIFLSCKTLAQAGLKNGSMSDELMNSIDNGDWNQFLASIPTGVDVNASGSDLRTPLVTAADRHETAMAAVLIYLRADVNKCCDLAPVGLLAQRKHVYPLWAAANSGDLTLCRILIRFGASVDQRGPYGTSPLHIAAGSEHPRIVSLLLRSGAHLNIKDDDGAEPILWARSPRTIKLLLRSGADINSKAKQGQTCVLTNSGISGDATTLHYLLKNGADPNLSVSGEGRLRKGYSPLMAAARIPGELDQVKELVEAGAQINAQDCDHDTALDYAQRELNNQPTIDFLISKGAKTGH